MNKKLIAILETTLILCVGASVTSNIPNPSISVNAKKVSKKVTKKSHKKKSKKKSTVKHKNKKVAKKTDNTPYYVGDSLDSNMLHDSSLVMNSQTNDGGFNPNKYIDNYKVGQYVGFYKLPTTTVLYSFPSSETDTSSWFTPTANDLNSPHKILDERTSSWGINYFLLQFDNNLKGWVMGLNIRPYTPKVQSNNQVMQQIQNSYNDNDMSQAAQLEYHYVNYIRIQHGLSPLQWDDTLGQIAKTRSEQIQTTQSHYDSNGQMEAAVLAKQNDFKYDWLYENIEGIGIHKNVYASAIDMINAYVYQDGLAENWGHRGNILKPDTKYIGIGISVSSNSYGKIVSESMLMSN